MRQVITAKDIQIYFGKKPSMSFKMLSQIKKDLKKLRHQPITISEFCNYYNVEKDGIVAIIKRIEKNKHKSASKIVSIENENPTNEILLNTSKDEGNAYAFSKRTW